MSHQEQPFADPGVASRDRRPINTDPREQPQGQAMPPPIMARPPRPGHSPWFWMGVSVVILVVIFGGLASVGALLRHDITTTKTFTIGNQPGLVLTAHSGDVHIVGGPAGHITVVARQLVFIGNNDTIPVHYNLSSDHNTLTVSVDSSPTFVFFSASSGIDFDVTVPSQTILNVQTSSGDITTQGVNGPMSLTASSGDITTDGGSGQISLTTSSGDIKASNSSGQMTLSASSGDITATNARASGRSSFQTSSGDITYRGSLAPNGSYDFHASSGDIDLTLPGSSALQVQATTNSGSIDSDFSGVNVLHGNGSGALASGTVGSAPYAHITLQTSSGNIHLRQG
jgi:hypothetical protein